VQVRKKRRRRRNGSGVTVLVPVSARKGPYTTLDFVQDWLSKGTGIQLLTVLDEFTRESLCIRVERRLRSEESACIQLLGFVLLIPGGFFETLYG